MLPNPFLGVTSRQGEVDVPITKVELEHGIRVNVLLMSFGSGLVPIYEEQASRIEANISLDAWAKMDVNEKALVIAMRRTTLAMRNLQTEAEIAKQKQKKV